MEREREFRPLSLERERFLLEEEVFLVFLTLRFLRFYWSAAQKAER
jgi:hypothetical protein